MKIEAGPYDSTMAAFTPGDTQQTLLPALPEHDYVSPGLKIVLPDAAFPNMIVGDPSVPEWPWLRRWVEQNWYTDQRHPTIGFASRDEAAILYNNALLFHDKECLEIGCWRGWSAVHLALGCGHLDVIDPIFVDPVVAADIANTFAVAGVQHKITAHDGYSPAAVDAVARVTGRRWSLIFIDGDHEGEAPRLDAQAVIRHAAETAMVLFHDLASPYVAAGMAAMREAGWRTMVYQTMQIMGVAWRGDIEPVSHTPDPRTPWTLPRHLAGYDISGWKAPQLPRKGAWRPGMGEKDRLNVALGRVQAVEDDFVELTQQKDVRDAQIASLVTTHQVALEAKETTLTRRTTYYEQQLREERDRAESFALQARRAEVERQHAVDQIASLQSSTVWRTISPALAWIQSHPRLRLAGRRAAKLLWGTSFQLVSKFRERRTRLSGVLRQQDAAPGRGDANAPGLAPPSSAGKSLPNDALLLLRALFVAEWHKPAESSDQSFSDYLQSGFINDVSPGPLFNGNLYRQRAEAAGLPPFLPGQSAILHWLLHGRLARVVPTTRFSETFYRKKNPDIDASPLWGFEHFIRHGLYEGRLPDKNARGFNCPSPGLRKTEKSLPRLYQHWLALDFPDRAETSQIAKAYHRRLEEVLPSDWMARTFSDAQAIDPDVGELDDIVDIFQPPLHDPIASVHTELRQRFPISHYDTVLCVPWIRTGGADLVASLLAKALLRIRPDERVLILRTDHPHFERANWLPGEVDCADISDLMGSLSPSAAEDLLRTVFRGLTAKRVINVNSRLCWTTLQRHGANLSATLATYSYMFCWDQTASGLRAGYPAAFFAGTASNITGFFTDTKYLRDELIRMYRLPAYVCAKITPLFTPAQRPLLVPSIARQAHERGMANRRLVLWAGRLDRQKRFDLVQEIARAMPDVEFHCWGSALLDAPPNLTRLPANIRMQGSFDSFDDLPLVQAGAWLYTALWEGMPTTLIELATRGVAIVASAVGGVPELIQEHTGWPIPAEAGSSAYVDALREVLSSPAAAIERAENLQTRVAGIYTESVYDAMLETVLAAEPVR